MYRENGVRFIKPVEANGGVGYTAIGFKGYEKVAATSFPTQLTDAFAQRYGQHCAGMKAAMMALIKKIQPLKAIKKIRKDPKAQATAALGFLKGFLDSLGGAQKRKRQFELMPVEKELNAIKKGALTEPQTTRSTTKSMLNRVRNMPDEDFMEFYNTGKNIAMD